jgi:Pyruvate/2-oxoacid:ferredoxin oxidoreductase gamma subunit
MLGAFAKATDWISLKCLKHILEQQFSGDVLSSNLQSCESAYRKVVVKTLTPQGRLEDGDNSVSAGNP